MSSRTIPMNEVYSRYVYKQPRTMHSYPINENWDKTYNFHNLYESLAKWRSYSKDETVCLEQVFKILDYIFENGTTQQKIAATNAAKSAIRDLQEPKANKALVTSAVSSSVKNQSVHEAYCSLEDALNEEIEKVRVCKNHDLISKRFNIDGMIKTLDRTDYLKDIHETMYDLVSRVDTYKMGLDSKFKIALEEGLFALHKNHYDVPEDLVVEATVDAFTTLRNPKDLNGEIFDIMGKVCKDSVFIKKDEYPRKLADACMKSVKSQNESSDFFSEGMIDTAKKAITDFKAKTTKSLPDWKGLVERLLIVNREEDFLENSVNLLSLAFYFTCVTAAFSIAVIPGVIAAIAAKALNFHMERKYFDKVLKKWYSHRDATAKKLEKCTDEEKKKRIEAYLKEVDKNIEKLEYHSDAMRGEDEDKSDAKRPKNYSGKSDDDFDFDMDFGDFGETAINNAKQIIAIAECAGKISWDKKMIEDRLFDTDSVEKMDQNDFLYLGEFVSKFPDALNLDSLLEAIHDKDRMMAKDQSVPMYVKRAVLSEAKEKVLSAKKDLETGKVAPEDTSKDVIQELQEFAQMSREITDFAQSIQELSMTSHLKLAIDKLDSIATNLSDAEKSASRTIDAAARMMSRAVERALTLENREAVIRGDILPSMSKCIKLAAAFGIAAFINPVLAMIGLVGKFALDRKIRTKERQLVCDELEVELKMIDKYIADADDKKDYKKERELMLIKKKLEAQHARLKYKIKVEWDDRSVKTDDKDED